MKKERMEVVMESGETALIMIPEKITRYDLQLLRKHLRLRVNRKPVDWDSIVGVKE
jgi:hypothetical protein